MTTIANLTSKRTTSTAGNNDSLTHTATPAGRSFIGFQAVKRAATTYAGHTYWEDSGVGMPPDHLEPIYANPAMESAISALHAVAGGGTSMYLEYASDAAGPPTSGWSTLLACLDVQGLSNLAVIADAGAILTGAATTVTLTSAQSISGDFLEFLFLAGTWGSAPTFNAISGWTKQTEWTTNFGTQLCGALYSRDVVGASAGVRSVSPVFTSTAFMSASYAAYRVPSAGPSLPIAYENYRRMAA